MIKIKHVTYNWERNACDEMLTDSGRVDAEEINLNSLIDRFGNMFLTHCYKTVLYVQLGEDAWEIIIPFNEETLNAFIFQNRDKYISIYQQTSHFYVHEKKCFNVVKLDTDAMIDEMSDEVKNKLSTKHKLSYGGGGCVSNAFGSSFAKVPTSASVNKFGKVATKASASASTNKFAKVPTKASTVTKAAAPSKPSSTTSTKPKIKERSKHFDEVPTNTKSVVSTSSTTSTSTSSTPSKKIIWEIQEDWD